MTPQIGWWIAGVIVWAGATAGLLSLRRWLLFYLVGAFGFVLLTAFGAAAMDLDTLLEGLEAVQVAALTGITGLGVSVVDATGLAIPSSRGWAVFDIGLECSALLEMAAITGLTMFYPAFALPRRVAFAAIGIVVTYAANIARIVLIVSIVSTFGTSWVFAAHAVFGRVLFFLVTVALYWWVMTRPTIGFTRLRLAEMRAR